MRIGIYAFVHIFIEVLPASIWFTVPEMCAMIGVENRICSSIRQLAITCLSTCVELHNVADDMGRITDKNHIYYRLIRAILHSIM